MFVNQRDLQINHCSTAAAETPHSCMEPNIPASPGTLEPRETHLDARSCTGPPSCWVQSDQPFELSYKHWQRNDSRMWGEASRDVNPNITHPVYPMVAFQSPICSLLAKAGLNVQLCISANWKLHLWAGQSPFLPFSVCFSYWFFHPNPSTPNPGEGWLRAGPATLSLVVLLTIIIYFTPRRCQHQGWA